MGRFSNLFEEADEAFDGKYNSEIKELTGLSQEEIDSVTPDTEGSTVYSELVKTVEDASKKNLSQAELAKNIKSLGDVAIKLSKKVPQLASIL